jgi:hypothetical protein
VLALDADRAARAAVGADDERVFDEGVEHYLAASR